MSKVNFISFFGNMNASKMIKEVILLLTIAITPIAAPLAWAAVINCMSNPCVGTDEDDQMHGTPQDDIIDARAGNDKLYGYEGNDRLNGGVGDDEQFGGTGNDEIRSPGGATTTSMVRQETTP